MRMSKFVSLSNPVLQYLTVLAIKVERYIWSILTIFYSIFMYYIILYIYTLFIYFILSLFIVLQYFE